MTKNIFYIILSCFILPFFMETKLLSQNKADKNQSSESQYYQELNFSLIDTYFIPKYRDFYTSASHLTENATEFCQNPTPHSLEKLQVYFIDALGKWTEIQHIRFGPAEKYMRTMKLYFWPDEKNRVSKMIHDILAKKDPNILKFFSKSSVAVQGFPALEKLLFDTHYQKNIENDDHSFTCQLVKKISQNIYNISKSMYFEWKETYGNKNHLHIEMANQSLSFSSHRELSQIFYTSLIEGLSILYQLQIGVPLGEKGETPKPSKLQNWPSQQEKNTLLLTIKSLHNMLGTRQTDEYRYKDLLTSLQKSDEYFDIISDHFDKIEHMIEQLPEPLHFSLQTQETKDSLYNIQRHISDIVKILTRDIAPKIDFTIGFNSLDGD